MTPQRKFRSTRYSLLLAIALAADAHSAALAQQVAPEKESAAAVRAEKESEAPKKTATKGSHAAKGVERGTFQVPPETDTPPVKSYASPTKSESPHGKGGTSPTKAGVSQSKGEKPPMK